MKLPRHSSWPRRTLALLLGLGGAYLVALIALVPLQRQLLFLRGPIWWSYRSFIGRPRPQPDKLPGLRGREMLRLPLEESFVEAWFLPSYQPERHPAPLVVYFHGTGEVIDDWAATLEPYRELGIHLLLPEYRGFGRSAGSPSEAALVADALKLIRAVSERPEVDKERIFFHGRSLGGAVAAALTVRYKPAALILQSTFTSLDQLTDRFLIPEFALFDRFDSISALRRFDRPTLILHCLSDRIVPFRHAQRLHGAISNSRLIHYPAGHNDCPGWWTSLETPNPKGYWPAWWSELTRFLHGAGIISDR